MANMKLKVPVHVEVQLCRDSMIPRNDVIKKVKYALQTKHPVFMNGPVCFEMSDIEFLDEMNQLVDAIDICELMDGQKVGLAKYN